MAQRIRRLIVLLAGVTLTAALVNHAVAQRPDDRSHAPLPNAGNPDFQRLFEERLRQMDARNQSIDKLQKELSKWLKDEDLAKLLDAMQKQNIKTDDPQWQDQIKKLIDQNKSDIKPPNISPEELDRLKKLVDATGMGKDKPPSHGEPPTTDKKLNLDPANQKKLWDQLKNDISKKAAPDPKTAADRADARKQLEDFAKRWEGLADKMGDSPAIQQALRDLAKSALDLNSTKLSPDDRLDAQLADLTRFTKDSGKWMGDSVKSLQKLNLGKLDLPPLPKVTMPNMPTVNLPDVNLPQMGGLPSIGMPRGGGMPASAGAWKEILLVVTLCVLGVVGWKMLQLWLAVRRDPRIAGWQPGAWPVDPARVASREDVVRAFDHLSLVRLGFDARHCHHLDIASRLGADEPRRQAAAQLAVLYERARYTPTDEALPPEALAAARRDLCLLAGVPAA